jgi:predicted nucleic acid-binding protein
VSTAYVDSSVLVGLAFGEASALREARKLTRHATLLTSLFTEAELESALCRAGTLRDPDPLAGVRLVEVRTSLRSELREVLRAGYIRGADCWHLAVALHYAPARDLTFSTLDKSQRAIARSLGFKV